MPECLCYILGKLELTEATINRILKIVKNQNTCNKLMRLAGGLTAAGMLILNSVVYQQSKDIKKLSKELEELKHKKGD